MKVLGIGAPELLIIFKSLTLVAIIAVIVGVVVIIVSQSKAGNKSLPPQHLETTPHDIPQEASGDCSVERLRELKELHDLGILTDEEFSKKKREILRL